VEVIKPPVKVKIFFIRRTPERVRSPICVEVIRSNPLYHFAYYLLCISIVVLLPIDYNQLSVN
jgi:hypothetical protein